MEKDSQTIHIEEVVREVIKGLRIEVRNYSEMKNHENGVETTVTLFLGSEKISESKHRCSIYHR